MNEQFKEQITYKAREFATAYTNRHFPNEPAFAFGHEGWAKFVDALVELAGAHPDKGTSALAAPVVPAHVALERAHELGFLRCAGWAQRDDLFSDVTSQAYRKDRAHDLATIATTPQAAPVAWMRDDLAKVMTNTDKQDWLKVGRHDVVAGYTKPLGFAAPVAQLSEPPKGWKLVPIVPTPQMLNAPSNCWPADALITWHEMLAAAPTTPKD